MGNLRTGMRVTGPRGARGRPGAGSLALLGGRAESLWKEPLRKTPGEGRGRGRCSRRQRGAGAGRVGVSVGRADCVGVSVGGIACVRVSVGGQAVWDTVGLGDQGPRQAVHAQKAPDHLPSGSVLHWLSDDFLQTRNK